MVPVPTGVFEGSRPETWVDKTEYTGRFTTVPLAAVTLIDTPPRFRS